VDVELVDADGLQRLELRLDLFGVADDAEAIADLVRDELTVLRAYTRVVVVVVELARLHVVGERLRHRAAVGAVPLDEIHDVVRDHRREPAHLVARVGEIVGDVTRRADDALELRRVATRLLGRAPRRVHDPRDDLRVGELDDDAVSDAAGDAERLRPIAGHPHRDLGQLLAHPLELELLVVPLHLAAVHEVLDHRERALEFRHLHRLAADVAHGGVAAPDAHAHSAVGEVVQRRVRAREHRRVARRRVRDEVAELDLRGLTRCDCERRDRLLPENVRVVRPRVLESVLLGELDQLEPARPRRVGKDGDAEADHAVATYRGVASEASAARIPMTTKPMRPSPGSENVRPTSGVPTTITNDASALTKPTAAPGASGRAAAAPVNAIANGIPAASPTIADAATRPASGSGAASATAAAPPATRLPATQRAAVGRLRIEPPTIRVKKPRRSVSEPTADAAPFDWPWCSRSVTTQFPTTTLNPSESAWIAPKWYRRGSRNRSPRILSPAWRAVRMARGEAASTTNDSAATTTAVSYGARNPPIVGTTAIAIPGASTEALPYTPCWNGDPPRARMQSLPETKAMPVPRPTTARPAKASGTVGSTSEIAFPAAMRTSPRSAARCAPNRSAIRPPGICIAMCTTNCTVTKSPTVASRTSYACESRVATAPSEATFQPTAAPTPKPPIAERRSTARA